MRGLIVLAAIAVSSTSVLGQECIRPEWGKCVSFPNGGSHTGMSIQKEKIQAEVTPGPDICVSNEEEIGGYTFAQRHAVAECGLGGECRRFLLLQEVSRAEV
jgi:hypothetical protein